MDAKGIDPERLVGICQDVDLRLAPMWVDVLSVEEWSFEVAWACIRCGYGHGYVQALIEAERGKLCRDHGLPVPTRGGLPDASKMSVKTKSRPRRRSAASVDWSIVVVWSGVVVMSSIGWAAIATFLRLLAR